MNVLISQIEAQFSERQIFSSRRGDDTLIQRIAPAEDCHPGDLVFVERQEFLTAVLDKKPSAIVVNEELAAQLPKDSSTSLLITKNVRLAQALIKQKYANRDLDNDTWGGIHPSAVIHESVQIPSNIEIGPHTVIGKNVKLAENCRILSRVTIESGVELGEGCLIHSGAIIAYNCQLGKNVEIGHGSVIGSEGFGYALDEKGQAYKIPQTGNVIIEDDVEIGANNCIDRGCYNSTRIGKGTKTDNLCHIAHSVQVGQNCMLTAMFCVGGSTEIGDRVLTSGQTACVDHVKVCSDTVFLHRAGITKNIEKPGMYAGLPLQPLAQYMKTSAHQKNLSEMSKKIKELEQQVQKLSSNQKG